MHDTINGYDGDSECEGTLAGLNEDQLNDYEDVLLRDWEEQDDSEWDALEEAYDDDVTDAYRQTREWFDTDDND